MHQTRLLSPYPSLGCRSYPKLLWGLRGTEYTLVPSPVGPLSTPLLISQISLGTNKSLSFMSLTIPRSKTKPHGFEIVIGCSGTPTFAECNMHSYLHYSASLSPIPHNSYLFVLPNGSPLLKSVLNPKIKCLVPSIDLDASRYSTHSMCTGVATTAAIAGFNEIQVKCIGGWSSQAYTLYSNKTNHLHKKINPLTINIIIQIRAS